MGEREDSTVGGVGTRRGSRTRAVSFWRCGTTDPTNAGPRVMWRMMRWNVFLGFAPGLMWLAMGLSRVRTVGGVDSAAIVTGLCMVIIALAFVQWRRIRRVLAHAKSVEYRVCPECGYSLVDLEEESGTCPECGTAYTRSGLWVVWTRG